MFKLFFGSPKRALATTTVLAVLGFFFQVAPVATNQVLGTVFGLIVAGAAPFVYPVVVIGIVVLTARKFFGKK